ncbi:MAG: hypothetical protein ACXWQO_07535 [Bdellovibrionota bacterium]
MKNNFLVTDTLADSRAQALLQTWYEHIKASLPEGSSLVAHVEAKAQKGFLVSFRAETENETFISEARDPVPARAVEEAGEGLRQRLIGTGEANFTFRDRLLRLFSEAG